jgi:ABC-type Fe3+ transport system permease subunit
MSSQRAIVAFVVVAVAAALAVGGYLLIGASAVRDTAPGTVTGHGILAMVLGVIGTVLMAGLLMGLAYFSHRSGHDDKAAGRDE